MAAVSLTLPRPASFSVYPASADKPVKCKFRVHCCKEVNGWQGRPGVEFASGNQNGSVGSPEKTPEGKPNAKRPPPRPRRIILVRHGESEGNVDETAYTKVPDPKIALTEKGHAEAEACGKRIRALIDKDGVVDWQVYFYVSPYRRTLETLRSLAKAFEKSRIAGVREEPRLREQDFGKNMQNQES